MAPFHHPDRQSLLPTFRAALDFCAAQTQRLITAHPNLALMYTTNGHWGREGELWTHWCDGFYPGICWLLFKQTGDRKWREAAEKATINLAPRRFDRTVHDLGFLFFSTSLRWYRLSGDAEQRQVLIDAGRTLALRRQKGGYLASFIGPHSLFIDVMMNVGIILWAANETGDDGLRQIALEHCRTTARYLVRPNGGTAHEGTFDVHTSIFREQTTHQGWRGDSAWSRGLAWAIYGFTAVTRLSGEAEFLDVARRCADYYLKRSPASLVPPWDYDIPDGVPAYYDSSAAAIAASGLWDLAEAVADPAASARFRGAALTILKSLCADEFLPRRRPEWEGILMHGVYHYHKGLGVDESVAWGDHFFVEALVKAVNGRSDAAW